MKALVFALTFVAAFAAQSADFANVETILCTGEGGAWLQIHRDTKLIEGTIPNAIRDFSNSSFGGDAFLEAQEFEHLTGFGGLGVDAEARFGALYWVVETNRLSSLNETETAQIMFIDQMGNAARAKVDCNLTFK